MLAANFTDCVDFLNCADFVVGVNDRNKRRLRGDCLSNFFWVDDAVWVGLEVCYFKSFFFEFFARFED